MAGFQKKVLILRKIWKPSGVREQFNGSKGSRQLIKVIKRAHAFGGSLHVTYQDSRSVQDRVTTTPTRLMNR